MSAALKHMWFKINFDIANRSDGAYNDTGYDINARKNILMKNKL